MKESIKSCNIFTVNASMSKSWNIQLWSSFPIAISYNQNFNIRSKKFISLHIIRKTSHYKNLWAVLYGTSSSKIASSVKHIRYRVPKISALPWSKTFYRLQIQVIVISRYFKNTSKYIFQEDWNETNTFKDFLVKFHDSIFLV